MRMQKTKILLVGPSWVGDMVMTQVLFQLLKEQKPDCELHVLAPAWTEALLSRMPVVAKTIKMPFSHGELRLLQRYQFAKILRSERYDQTIILPNSLKSALIPFFAHIPLRTGWLGEYRFGLLNDIRYLNKALHPQMAQRFAALAFSNHAALPVHLPKPQLSIDNHSVESALQKHQLQLSAKKPVIALCPGAEFGPSKCWPTEYFAIVANQKIAEGFSVWILGSANDQAIAATIQQQTHSRCENLVGKTTLAEAVDLLSLVQTAVTNDSGLMHIAAAVGCKVVAIYGSTSPDFTPPLTDKAIILKTELDCQPCFQRTCPLQHHHCMKQLLPEKVLENL